MPRVNEPKHEKTWTPGNLIVAELQCKTDRSAWIVKLRACDGSTVAIKLLSQGSFSKELAGSLLKL